MIIAIVTLVFALVFVNKVFTDLTDQSDEWPSLQLQPTIDDPIVFIPILIDRGEDNKMTIKFFNSEMDSIPDTVTPQINCNGIASVTVTATGLEVLPGEINIYSALVFVPKQTEKKTYSCIVSISDIKKTFFMEID